MAHSHSFRRLLVGVTSGLALGSLGSMITAAPGWSAEKITMKYGPIYRSIYVADLKDYAKTGQPSPELGAFLNLVKPKERESLTKTLNMKFPFNVVQVDRLLKTPMADGMLKEVSSATILPGGKEDIALRGAMLIAASSSEGLGTLSLLESYPTPTLTVDVKQLLSLMKNSQAFKGLGTMMNSFGGSMPKAAPVPAPAPK